MLTVSGDRCRMEMASYGRWPLERRRGFVGEMHCRSPNRSSRAREATRIALPGGGYFFLVYSRATGSLAQVAGSAERVA